MSESRDFHALLDGPYSLTVRPQPVPGDLRMSWGIAVLLLILANSRGKRASFQKLQLIAHSVRSEEGRSDLMALLELKLKPSEVSPRVEPWLNRAVSFAHAQGFIEVDKGRVAGLTDRGQGLAASIQTQDDVLTQEKDFLRLTAPRLTEALVTRVWRMEDLL